MKIHHVGYLTKDLRASEKAFLKLGYEVEFPAAFDSLRDITITFLRNGYSGRSLTAAFQLKNKGIV